MFFPGRKSSLHVVENDAFKSQRIGVDDPTNHGLRIDHRIKRWLDGLHRLIVASRDHQFIQTLANRIIAVSSKGVVDRAETTYDEFLENKDVQKRVAEMNQ